jgi:heat shock protein HslJ
MKPALCCMGLLIATLAGCSSDGLRLEQRRTYQVDFIAERPVLAGSHLTLTLDRDGRAYGNGGCNHWFAQYHLQDDQLGFGEVGSTRRACRPELMEQEQRFFQALQAVQRWDALGDDDLRLWPASGAPLRLEPVID